MVFMSTEELVLQPGRFNRSAPVSFAMCVG